MRSEGLSGGFGGLRGFSMDFEDDTGVPLVVLEVQLRCLTGSCREIHRHLFTKFQSHRVL